MNTQKAAVALAVMLATASCSSSISQEAAAPSPATSASPTGEPIPSTQPASPANTASPTAEPASSTQPLTWEAGLARVQAGLNELFSNPDPDRLGEYVDPACRCMAPLKHRLEELARAGQHYRGDSQRIDKAVLRKERAPGDVEVMLTLPPLTATLVDAQGEVVSSDTTPAGMTAFRLLRGEDGVWRLRDRSTDETFTLP